MHYLTFLTLLFTASIGNIPAFAPDMQESLYMGVENHIKINLNGVNAEDIEVKTTGANVYKRSDSLYTVTVSNDYPELKVKLYYKKIIVDSKVLPVVALPDPSANVIGFGLESNGQIKKDHLSKIKELSIKYAPNFPKNYHSKIMNYQIVLLKGQRVIASQYISNNTLDDNIKQQIAQMTAGDRIQLNNIVGQNTTTSVIQNLGSKIITIVE